jgi:hypothetical protein
MHSVIHLAQRACNLRPHGVEIIVERLKGEDLEFGLLLRKEGEDTRCRHKARHHEELATERSAADRTLL